jgi:hypothetical protein
MVARPAAVARTAMLTWRDAYPLSDTSSTVTINAADLAADHHLRIWDSVIIAALRKPVVDCCLRITGNLIKGGNNGSPGLTGIHLDGYARNCTITGNVISNAENGNMHNGVVISGPNATANVVVGNRIAATTPLSLSPGNNHASNW